jgi:hypothetical protein
MDKLTFFPPMKEKVEKIECSSNGMGIGELFPRRTLNMQRRREANNSPAGRHHYFLSSPNHSTLSTLFPFFPNGMKPNPNSNGQKMIHRKMMTIPSLNGRFLYIF